MKKNKKTLVIAGLIALVVCASLALMFFLFRQKGPEHTEQKPAGEPTLHSVTVKNDKDSPLEDIAVYIYTDSDKEELVWFSKTDADGKITFTDVPSDSYVAVLENVPTGYSVDAYYPLTGLETEIVLSVGQMTEEAMQTLTYQLGDLVMDFSVTATDGNVYSLFELLNEKHAVVLNFWYLDCQPCLMEFPFLQEAYAEYSDKVAVLALNPIDKIEDIAVFQQEKGYTFPMAAVDQSWINIMKLSAFPTTVVIDRYGNITLMHTGSIDNAQTFKDVFEFFCAEEYEQKFVKDITEIESEKEKGSEENPEELGGVTSFDVTVGPGQVYYTDLFRVTDMYLTIYSKDAYVIYNEKTYKPQNGVIQILLQCPDTYTPVHIGIGNSSEKEQTFKVYLIPKPGTFNNPFPLEMGEFTASVEAGNEKGIYYIYTLQEDGQLLMQCLSATPGVKYTYSLFNMETSQMRNLEEDGTTADGINSVAITGKKGQKILFSIGSLPDETNKYPSAKFQMRASFDNGVAVEEIRLPEEKIQYYVTVKDQNGDAVPGVSVNFAGTVISHKATETLEAITEQADAFAVTNNEGVAIFEHYPGTLQVKLRVPEGYTLDNNSFTVSAENPAVTVTLQKILYKDYGVKVLTPDGDPVSGMIIVLSGKVAYTDAQGSAVFSMPHGDYTALVLGAPRGYTLADISYDLTVDAPEVTVNLSYALGHETNPIEIRELAKFKVEALEAGEARYYTVYDVNGTTLNLEMTNGYILVNGTKYEPQEIPSEEEGVEPKYVISVDLEEGTEPITLAVVNTDSVAKKLTVNFAFPLGTKYNPEQITARKSYATLSSTVESYYFYYPTAKNVVSGTMKITVNSATGDDFDIIITNGDQTAKLSESDNDKQVTLEFTGNKQISVQVVATKPLTEAIEINPRCAVTPVTGKEYSVTIVNEQNQPLSGVALQFMQGGEPVGDVYTTDEEGVAKAGLAAGTYTIQLLDSSYEYDVATAKVTSSNTSVTISVTQTEEPVPEGMTRYKVNVTDYLGKIVGNYLVLFMKDGEPVDYNIVGEAGGITTKELETGTYTIDLAFLGETVYHYEKSAAVVTPDQANLTVKVAAEAKTVPEENWQLGQVIPVSVGGSYVPLQPDVNTYYVFTPVEQGVYRIAVSDPNAVLSYWGSTNFPMDITSTLTDFDGKSFTISVNTNALGQTRVVGIMGAEGCILSVERIGDAVEDVPFTPYEPTKAPVAQSLPAGLNFTYVDITKPTGTYNLVFNETDGYYHMGSANGPIVYIQLDYDADGDKPPYLSLYEMVGGVNNTATGFRCVYTDAEGNEVREDYTNAVLAFGACTDETYGVYPLTKDLEYMVKMGGQYMGWWDADNANSQMLFANGENLEIAWMFALCYVG